MSCPTNQRSVLTIPGMNLINDFVHSQIITLLVLYAQHNSIAKHGGQTLIACKSMQRPLNSNNLEMTNSEFWNEISHLVTIVIQGSKSNRILTTLS